MNEKLKQQVPIQSDEDVITARQSVRKISQEMGFSMLEQTRLITALSELARNIVIHAGSGEVQVYEVCDSTRNGIKIFFQDSGPGIENVDKAMEEGFSSVGSLGLGLSGSKRLVDDFDIESTPGSGTTVTIVKWK